MRIKCYFIYIQLPFICFKADRSAVLKVIDTEPSGTGLMVKRSFIIIIIHQSNAGWVIITLLQSLLTVNLLEEADEIQSKIDFFELEHTVFNATPAWCCFPSSSSSEVLMQELVLVVGAAHHGLRDDSNT